MKLIVLYKMYILEKRTMSHSKIILVNISDADIYTLMKTSNVMCFKIIKYLKGTGTNRLNNIFIIACINLDIRIVEMLICFGVDVNFVDSKGVTPLMYSSRKGCANLVNMLIKNGANVNSLSRDRRTNALGESLKYRHVHIAKILIDNGARTNVNFKINRLRTMSISDLAVLNNCSGIIDYMKEHKRI